MIWSKYKPSLSLSYNPQNGWAERALVVLYWCEMGPGLGHSLGLFVLSLVPTHHHPALPQEALRRLSQALWQVCAQPCANCQDRGERQRVATLWSWQPGGRQPLQHNEDWGGGSAVQREAQNTAELQFKWTVWCGTDGGPHAHRLWLTARTTLYPPLCPTAWHGLPDTAGALEGKVCRPGSWP